METKRSVMSFKTDGPREDITEDEIKSAMDLVLEKGIFAFNGAEIVSTLDAKVIVTDTTDYDLVIE